MRRVGREATFPLGMILVATVMAACAGSPASQPAPGSGALVARVEASRMSSIPAVSASPASAHASPRTTEIDVAQPTALSVEGSTIWAVAQRDVARVVPAAGTATILGAGNGDSLAAIAATPDAVWVADFDGQTLLRIDPTSGSVAARISVPSPIEPLDVGDSIWVTNYHEGSVTRVDAKTNEVIDSISIGDPGEGGPGTLASGHGDPEGDRKAGEGPPRPDRRPGDPAPAHGGRRRRRRTSSNGAFAGGDSRRARRSDLRLRGPRCVVSARVGGRLHRRDPAPVRQSGDSRRVLAAGRRADRGGPRPIRSALSDRGRAPGALVRPARRSGPAAPAPADVVAPAEAARKDRAALLHGRGARRQEGADRRRRHPQHLRHDQHPRAAQMDILSAETGKRGASRCCRTTRTSTSS